MLWPELGRNWIFLFGLNVMQKFRLLPPMLLSIHQAANQNSTCHLSVFCRLVDVTAFPEGRAHFTDFIQQT